MSRPSCPDAHKPVLHSGHDDFAEVAVAQLIGHPGTRDQGRRAPSRRASLREYYARLGLAANKLVQIMGLLCV